MRFRKLIWSGFLAVTMTLSGVMPQTILAANETGLKNNVNIAESIQDADPAETEEPVFTAPEGTYVPGEVIVCVKEAAFDEKRIASQVNGSAFGRLFGAKPDLSSEELMDVSHAAAEIENEKKGIDQEGPVATGQAPEKTVLKAVHSDTLSTEELMKLYFMKQKALDSLQKDIPENLHFYQSNASWIDGYFNNLEAPKYSFDTGIEVQDYQLLIGGPEVDFQNAKI